MRTIRTETPGAEVRRYLRHWANPAFVENALNERHTSMPRDIRRRKAREVAVCIDQGLEYLATSRAASVLTRPLSLFYAHENLAKASCVFLDPSLHANDFKAHGLKHDSAKRYSIKNLQAHINKPSKDVWSRYARLCNWQRTIYTVTTPNTSTNRDTTATFRPTPAPGRQLTMGRLALVVPELVEDVIIARWGVPTVVHVTSYSIRLTSEPGTEPPPQLKVRMTLRHGHHKPTHDLILSRRHTRLKDFDVEDQRLDVVKIRSKPSIEDPAFPAFCMDVFLEPHIDLTQTRTEIAEPLAFYAMLFILSSVVRYEPEQWQRLLLDHPAEAILVERLLNVAERKVPNLVLNQLHNSYIHFST